jgi:hypothetical protein
MDRRYVLTALIGGMAALAATGVVFATTETRGPVFIAGDKPVTEEQVRSKLPGDGYADVRIAREGHYFEATGARDGKAAKLRLDAQTGRLDTDDDDDDD